MLAKLCFKISFEVNVLCRYFLNNSSVLCLLTRKQANRGWTNYIFQNNHSRNNLENIERNQWNDFLLAVLAFEAAQGTVHIRSSR